jgi:uncharacterized protein (DUF1015 family)
VPEFLPFRATRHAPAWVSHAADLWAPPYDVLSTADRERLAAAHEHNIVHVDVPVPPGAVPRPEAYAAAAARLAAWRTHGVLVTDAAASYTIVRTSFVDAEGRARTTVGVMGALRIEAPDSTEVRPHERTTPKDSTDRLDLTRATRAQLSPVWGLSSARGLTDLLVAPGQLVGEATDADGVMHRYERVDDAARLAQIARLAGSAPVVIADGHHRYAVSRHYRDEPDAPPAARSVLTHLGELVEDQLAVAAIHRLFTAPDAATLETALRAACEPREMGPMPADVIARMSREGCMVMLRADGTALGLTPRSGAFPGVRDLDSARLEHALAGVGAEAAYQHGLDRVRARLARGEAVAAVLIRPVGIGEILRTAREGALMPPKSTFFAPKLRTGPVLRLLDD